MRGPTAAPAQPLCAQGCTWKEEWVRLAEIGLSEVR